MGFCRVCGLLEPGSKGCGGPPDFKRVEKINMVPDRREAVLEPPSAVLQVGVFPKP